MSTGMVICSICKREVHQGAGIWFHCEDRSPRCELASSIYPRDISEVQGKYCGMDGLPQIVSEPPVRPSSTGMKPLPNTNRHMRRAIAVIERRKLKRERNNGQSG